MASDQRRRVVAVRWLISGLLAPLLLGGGLSAQAPDRAAVPASGEWRSLFDGNSLAGWKESDFFGAGKVSVDKGVILLGAGALTASPGQVRLSRSLPQIMRSASRPRD